MNKIKVLLIEDNRILRDGIKEIINKQPDLTVVSAFGGNHNSLAQVRRLNPHVVLIDLGLRSENGLHLVAALSKELPTVKVIGMGLIPAQADIIEFVQAGAAGFLLKDATVREVLATIRSVAAGIKVLPPVLAGSLFSLVVDQAVAKAKGRRPNAVRMTTREREIIVLIAEGMSNKELAERLNLSVYTVKSHIHNILEKLALHSRLEIAVHSYDNNGL